MQLVDQENGWTLFEDDKTFPDGVVVIARYVVYGDLKVGCRKPKTQATCGIIKQMQMI